MEYQRNRLLELRDHVDMNKARAMADEWDDEEDYDDEFPDDIEPEEIYAEDEE